ncbi:MAG: hypothetical protein IPM79_18360 [Polyangiaceae bacterium]|nr:hypothetical protein [Polyangiaceae bacterium]
MGRVPDEEIERLKREISLERLCEARGVVLEKRGADLVGRCPFHEDRTPSFVVTPSANLWHCLGACQAGGSVIDFVMRADGVSFRHAVEILRGAPLEALGPVTGAIPVDRRTRKLATLAERGVEDTELLGRVVELYHAALGESPEALEYVRARGISAEAVRHFRLGYANRTLGYRLPDKNRKAGAELRGQLTALGVFRERARAPLGLARDPAVRRAGARGAAVRAQGARRSAGGDAEAPLPAGTAPRVFNRVALEHAEEVIVCEALIDALTFWSAGYRHVTSAYGVEGVTEELVEGCGGERGACEDRLRSGRGWRAGSGAAGGAADGARAGGLSGGVPEGDGRERIRGEGEARDGEPGSGAEAGALDGQGRGPRARSSERSAEAGDATR